MRRPCGHRAPNTRGRIPRRWVFIGGDNRGFLHLKVTRSRIRAIERIAEAHGWDFLEALKRVFFAGLTTLDLHPEATAGTFGEGRDDSIGGGHGRWQGDGI